MPQRLTEYLLKSSRKMEKAREHQKLMEGFAKRLMDQKYEAALQGKGSRDVLSLIGRFHSSSAYNDLPCLQWMPMFLKTLRPGCQMQRCSRRCSKLFLWLEVRFNRETPFSEPSCWPDTKQQRTPFRGHCLSSPGIRIYKTNSVLKSRKRFWRKEVICSRSTIMRACHILLQSWRLDCMAIFYGFCWTPLQETLRFHPNAYHLFREAEEDDVLPLTTPVTLTDGRVIKEVPIRKGQKIITSVSAYNR